MNIVATLPNGLWQQLSRHLLPLAVRHEQAAFLFTQAGVNSQYELHIRVVASYLLDSADFDDQQADYLEVSDECKNRVIKRAHELGAGLIEVHSHLGPWPAVFSSYDLLGLRESVPHVLWRLPGQPYAALVFARSGFDALVWVGKGEPARPLSKVLVDNLTLLPTNLTLEILDGRSE